MFFKDFLFQNTSILIYCYSILMYFSSRAKEIEHQDEYTVEKIVDKCIRNNKVEYFLKWNGYDD